MGVVNFFMQMNPDVLATYPESHRAIVASQPVWVTAGFAIAVFGGALGCLLLLLRKFAAYYVFVASLLGTIVVLAHTLSLTIDFSASDIMMIILMPLAVAVLLVWYSKRAAIRGWIH